MKDVIVGSFLAAFTMSCCGCSLRANDRTSQPHHGALVENVPGSVDMDSTLPDWVEVPHWMENDGQQTNALIDETAPVVSVVSRVIRWSQNESDPPVISPDRYAIMGTAAADRIIASLIDESYSSLTSPNVVVSSGQSAWVAILAKDLTSKEDQDTGVVFFVEPASINKEGADLRFSYQSLEDSRGGRASGQPKSVASKLEGHAKLEIGQWYVQGFEGNNPNGINMALFIQIERVDFPQENATSFGG